MSNVSIRELRNNGGEVVERAARGETIVITKSGEPVAELRALPRNRRRLSTRDLIAKRQRLGDVDPEKLKADLDNLIDPSV